MLAEKNVDFRRSGAFGSAVGVEATIGTDLPAVVSVQVVFQGFDVALFFLRQEDDTAQALASGNMRRESAATTNRPKTVN